MSNASNSDIEKPVPSMVSVAKPSSAVEVERPALAPAPTTPMQMLQLAVERGASVEILDKLLNLQERVEANQARKEFDAAFAAVKAEVGIIKKTGTGHNGKKYADMADIARALDPVIAEHGLSYRFRANRVANELIVTCVICHRAGHYEENSLPGPLDLSGSKNPIQAVGSTCTYLQRYTLIAAFGLAASVEGNIINDDDGEGANTKPRIENGWPRGDLQEAGDYAGGTPERDSKPKEIPNFSRGTYGQRFEQFKYELELCETEPELDATANEIEKRPQYLQLPKSLKDAMVKVYANRLAQIKLLDEEDERDKRASLSQQAIEMRERNANLK